MCKNWREKGNCKYGDKCLFAHGADELTKRSSANGPEPAKPLISASTPAPAETKKEVIAKTAEVAEASPTTPKETKVSLPIAMTASDSKQ